MSAMLAGRAPMVHGPVREPASHGRHCRVNVGPEGAAQVSGALGPGALSLYFSQIFSFQ
jgi:hypothetical protein